MNEIVIAMAALISIYLPKPDREAALLFLSLSLLFNAAGRYIPDTHGTIYYVGAGINDLLIIYLLSKMNKPTELVVGLQNVAMSFIIVNLLGWVIYMLYLSPAAYDLICSALYVWALLMVADHYGNSRMDNSNRSIYKTRGYSMDKMRFNTQAKRLP